MGALRRWSPRWLPPARGGGPSSPCSSGWARAAPRVVDRSAPPEPAALLGLLGQLLLRFLGLGLGLVGLGFGTRLGGLALGLALLLLGLAFLLELGVVGH